MHPWSLHDVSIAVVLLFLSATPALADTECKEENLDTDTYVETCLETAPQTNQIVGIRSILHEKKPGTPGWAKAAQIVISGFALPYAASRPLPHGKYFYDVHFQVGAAIGATSSAITSILLDRAEASRACEGQWHLEQCRRLKIKKFWISALTGIVVSSAAGALKEFRDMGGRGDPDFNDALFTSIGGGFGSFTMSIPLDSIFKKRK